MARLYHAVTFPDGLVSIQFKLSRLCIPTQLRHTYKLKGHLHLVNKRA